MDIRLSELTDAQVDQIVGNYVDAVRERVEETLGRRIFAELKKEDRVLGPGDSIQIHYKLEIDYLGVVAVLAGGPAAIGWKDAP